MRVWAVCLVAVFGLVGCGDDGGNEGGGAKPEAAKPDKPKKRPPFTEELHTRLSTRTLAGFSGSISRLSGDKLMMVFRSDEKTPGGAKIAVHTTLQACDITACYSMDPSDKMNEQWAKQAREMLEKQGYQDPVFDVGTIEVAPGYKAFMYYQRGHKVEVLEGGRESRGSVHGFNVRYHDGSNAILLRVYAHGMVGAKSAEDLEKAMPRAMAEDAARKVFGLYADLFEKGGS